MMDDLPDELLLQILQYLTPYDLKNVEKLNTRFSQLIHERNLWIRIDCRGRRANSELVDYFNERVHADTKAYMLRAADCLIVSPERIRKWTNYNSLTILVLECMHFDSDEITLGNFPVSLLELSLNRSTFSNSNFFFRFAGRKLKSLRVITLEHCLTLTEGVVMPLANFEQLEIVSLYGCMGIKDALVPLAMSTKHGFRQLKVLDVRCTGLGNDLLRLAADLENLGELYFHCYFHYIEESIRDAKGGGGDIEKLLQCHSLDMSTNHGLVEACGRNVVGHYKAQFADEGLRYYRKTSFCPQGYIPPKSVLYERPYRPCTCSTKSSAPMPSSSQHNTNSKSDSSSNESPASTSSATPTAPQSKKRPRSPSPDAIEAKIRKTSNSSLAFQPVFFFGDGDTSTQTPPPSQMTPWPGRDAPNSVVIEIKLYPRQGEPADGFIVTRRRINPDAFGRERHVLLSALSLRGSARVTDHGLESLQQLDLELLDVTGTGVTAAGVAAFQARMPRCRVVHETACTCRPR